MPVIGRSDYNRVYRLVLKDSAHVVYAIRRFPRNILNVLCRGVQALGVHIAYVCDLDIFLRGERLQQVSPHAARADDGHDDLLVAAGTACGTRQPESSRTDGDGARLFQKFSTVSIWHKFAFVVRIVHTEYFIEKRFIHPKSLTEGLHTDQ